MSNEELKELCSLLLQDNLTMHGKEKLESYILQDIYNKNNFELWLISMFNDTQDLVYLTVLEKFLKIFHVEKDRSDKK